VRHTIDHKTSLRRGLLADILVEQGDPDVIASLLEAACANAVAASSR
jgi:hypothetical protein